MIIPNQRLFISRLNVGLQNTFIPHIHTHPPVRVKPVLSYQAKKSGVSVPAVFDNIVLMRLVIEGCCLVLPLKYVIVFGKIPAYCFKIPYKISMYACIMREYAYKNFFPKDSVKLLMQFCTVTAAYEQNLSHFLLLLRWSRFLDFLCS